MLLIARSHARVAALVVAGVLFLSACVGGYGGYGRGAEKPGGEGTSSNYGVGAFSQPASNLSADEIAIFRIGNVFVTEPWSAAPGAVPERDGLGPTYLASSCAGCHVADGRDATPGVDASSGTPILRFVDSSGAGWVMEDYNLQIQTRSISGVSSEADIEVAWQEERGAYPDGSPYSLRSPVVTVGDAAYGSLDGAVASGIRIAPPLIGLGLLEAISEEDIVANADPSDADGDGISGVASYVESATLGGRALGRFGLKANVATVADQAANAFLFDMGITSAVYPDQNCPPAQSECAAAPSGGAPEISQDRLEAVIFYARTLAVPGRKEIGDETVVAGDAIFGDLGCSACHVQRFVTSNDHVIEAVRGQTIYPYTDLLLHDMGPGLSDGRTDGQAGASEWRTAPLWGLGLMRTVNPGAGFLHDGRARTIEEAILWHGGEATASRDGFTALSGADRERVLIFLKSL